MLADFNAALQKKWIVAPVRSVRIFVSSPADVDRERAIVREVIERLAHEYRPYFSLRAMLWEDEALTADRTFQAGLTRPCECEIVLVILWTRLGSPLPEDPYRGMTGTEWEFIDAVTASNRQGLPEVLVYKKTTPKLVDITDAESVQEALADRARLDAFFRNHFFNDDNSFKRAFRTFDNDARFRELLDVQLRKLLNRRIGIERRAAAGEHPWHGSPFRHGQAFAARDERVFTGREAELRELTGRLAKGAAAGCALVLLSGPSGCGKTSLLRAGLLPRLARPFCFEQIASVRACLLTPMAADPLGALATALCAEACLGESLRGFGLEAAQLSALFATDPGLAARQLGAALREQTRLSSQDGQSRLVVIVDPLEGVFVRPEQPPAALLRGFAETLVALALSGDIWVVAALRDHALHDLPRLPALAERLGESAWQRLEPLPTTRIRQIVEIPARIAGIELATQVAGAEQELVERIENEAAPLRLWAPAVEALLDDLYHGATQDAQDGTATVRLELRHWCERGGLAGHTLERARQLWRDRLDASHRAALPRLCRALLSLEGDHQIQARAGHLAVLEQDPQTRHVLAVLIEARLLITEAERDTRLLADCEAVDDSLKAALTALWRQTQGEWLGRLRGRSAVPDGEALAQESATATTALDWASYTPVVSLAHPVLFQAWEPIQTWLSDPNHRAWLRLRGRLSRQARLWKRTSCNREYLFGAAGFAAVQGFAARFPDELEPLEHDYLRHNGAWLAFLRQRNRVVRAFGLLLIVLFLTATVAAWIAQRKSRDVRLALHRVQLKEANLQSLDGNTPQAVDKALNAGLDLPADAVRVLSLAFSRNRLLAVAGAPAGNQDGGYRPAANASGDRLAVVLPGQGVGQWQLSDGRFRPAQPALLSDGSLGVHSLVMDAQNTVFGIAEHGVYRLPAFAGDRPLYDCGAQAGASLALDPQRRYLALAVPGESGHQGLCVLDLTQPGRVLFRQALTEQTLRGLHFSAAGDVLLSASTAGRTHLIELDPARGTGALRLSLPADGPLGRPFNQAVFDASAQRLAIAAADERVRLYRRDGQPLGELRHSDYQGRQVQIHNSAVRDVAFAPDGQSLVAVDDEGQVVRWSLADAKDAKPHAMVLGHHDGLSIVHVEVAASPSPGEGALVLTASLDATARLWTLDTGKPLAIFGHDAALNWARFADSGQRVLSYSHRDQSLRLWSVKPVSRLAFGLQHTDPGNHVWHLDMAPIPPERLARTTTETLRPFLLASAGYDGQVQLWRYDRDGRQPRLIERFAGQAPPAGSGASTPAPKPVRRVQFSPSGRLLAAARFDGTASVYDLLSGQACHLDAGQPGKGKVFRVLFDPGEHWLLTTSDDPSAPVRLFDPRRCEPLAMDAPLWEPGVSTKAAAILSLAGGTVVALGDEAGQIRLLQQDAGDHWHVRCERHAGLGAISDLAFSADGQLLAVAGEDPRLGLLALETTGCGSIHYAEGHSGRLYSVDFSPDGQQLVTASLDKTARVWTRAGQPLAVLTGHQDRLYHASFSPEDGRWLLSASRDGSLRLWRAPPAQQARGMVPERQAFLPLRAHAGGAAFGAFSPDGHYVVGAYWENAALLWRVWSEDDRVDRQRARHWGAARARLALVQEAYRFQQDNRLSDPVRVAEDDNQRKNTVF